MVKSEKQIKAKIKELEKYLSSSSQELRQICIAQKQALKWCLEKLDY